uniref:denticleless protein homolog B-like n=1 Tax=Styela clava TaxID=7725 RepID=UPI00193AB4D6|nr:denticleless protein homolog B-like [Styela clava]
MAFNVGKLTFIRQIGMSNTRYRKCVNYNEKDFVNSFNQHHMQDIFCASNQKYVVPGELEPEVPPYTVEFCTASGSEHTFAVADENGIVSLFIANEPVLGNDADKVLRPLHKLEAHNNAIFDIAWIPHEHSLATASGDQTAALWDTLKGEVITVFKGHSCSLKSVNVSKQNLNLLATGSRDGNALIWDRRTSSQPVVRIQDAHVINDSLTPMRKRRRALAVDTGQLAIDSRQTVSSAIFQDSNTVITSGAMDGMLKIWDLRKIQTKKKTTAKGIKRDAPLEMIPYPGLSQRRRGYTCLTLDSSNTNLYASCTDDSIYHYNLSTLPSNGRRQPICKYQGHYNTSFYVRSALSPDDQFLLSGSDDNKAYIWKATGKDSSPILRLVSEGMSEVTAVAWCPYDYTKMVTCSDECVVRVWNLPYNGMGNFQNIDGRGEIPQIKKKEAFIKSGFTPTSVVRVEPQLETSPTTVKSTTNHIFTPQKLTFTSSPPNSSSKLCTPLRNLNNQMRTPTSIEKWIVRTPTQKKLDSKDSNRNRVVKCLENHMAKEEPILKENEEIQSSDSKLEAGNKNWLLELSKRRRSKDIVDSPARKKQKSAASLSVNNNRTPAKSFRTLDCYFSSPKSER